MHYWLVMGCINQFLSECLLSRYIACGCGSLKLILKSFGPVIKSNVTSPPPKGGIDITREERWVLAEYRGGIL